MYQVTVGTKYQIVIPKEVRKEIQDIKPGTKVGVYVSNGKVTIKPEQGSWLSRTRGMMTEAWKGLDTTTELAKMRNEWEERMQEVEKSFK